MKYYDKVPAVLLLEDGSVFYGKSAGCIGTTTGEICFNTGMTGYQEIFTDPSYYGQILVMTNAHIGNYGSMGELKEVESDNMKISGLVCKNFTNLFSRKVAAQSIQEYFTDEGMVGITDVDTRAIVRHIRDKGAMNAIISSDTQDLDELEKQLEKVPRMSGLELSSKVSTEKAYVMGDSDADYQVAALDLGIKKNILRNLVDRGCHVKVFPAKTAFKDIQKWEPDGLFVSNGPGDPGAMPYAVECVREALNDDMPTFGICLGHQILARALDLDTYKMHHGHRGINHPVKNMVNGHAEITTQNHGFGVKVDEVKNSDDVEITHINLNDESVEGFRHLKKPAFSVQYHPEASPGPHDSRYLFDEFIKLMEGEKIFDEEVKEKPVTKTYQEASQEK